MPFKFNPLTGQLDLVNPASTATGNVTGVPPTDINAIARWDDTTGTTIKNSPGTLIQDGSAIQAGGFLTRRAITTLIVVPTGYSWVAPSLELELTGEIDIELDAEVIIV